jgi:hypothetical protein
LAVPQGHVTDVFHDFMSPPDLLLSAILWRAQLKISSFATPVSDPDRERPAIAQPRSCQISESGPFFGKRGLITHMPNITVKIFK